MTVEVRGCSTSVTWVMKVGRCARRRGHQGPQNQCFGTPEAYLGTPEAYLLMTYYLFTVWESPSRPFLFFSFWVSLKIKGKKTPVLFFSFFFLSFLLRLSGATRRRRESYPRLLHLKYITSKRSPYAQHFHNT